MRRRLILGLLVVCFSLAVRTDAQVAGGAPGVASGSPIPEVIYSDWEHDHAPIWVSVEAAVDNDGEINWSLLGEAAQSVFDSVLRNDVYSRETLHFSPDVSGLRRECVYFGTEDFVVDPPEGPSVGEVVSEIPSIYRGKIVGIDQGFYRGAPGSLLEIRVVRTFKSSAEQPNPDEVYLYYPFAQFDIADLTVCKRDPRYPLQPDLGDEVFFFGYGRSDFVPFVMFQFGFGDIALYKKGRQPLLPPWLAGLRPNLSGAGPDALARLVATEVSGSQP